jgi:phospholipid/cholesterol/gamma-HCH transport system substrate-binding protein
VKYQSAPRLFLGLLATALILSACGVSSVEDVALPGTKGTGDGALVITADLPDVGTLTKNAQVKVDDVVVGTVTDIEVKNWHARATLSLEPDVELPEKVAASVGVNSLLGSAYVELAPAPGKSGGELRAGTAVPLKDGHAYPSTEQVLSSASVVLNGGGLEQISTITRETNRALDGDGQAFADLLPRLERFVSTVNQQQDDIRSTIGALDRTAGRYAANRETITTALDELGPALRVVAKERSKLTKALTSLSDLRGVAVPLIDETHTALVNDLEDIAPTLAALESAGPDLVRALGFMVTFPFSPDSVTRACRTDYCNLFVTIDLTNQSILDGFLKKDGTLDIPGIGPLPGLADLTSGTADDSVLLAPLKGVLDALLAGEAENGSASGGTQQKPAGESSREPSSGLLGGLLDYLGGK